MRPKRYPYRQKGPTELTIDPKLKTRLLCDFSLVEHLLTDPAMRLWCQHDEIARLRREVAVNTSELNNIKRKLSSNLAKS